MLRSLAMMNYGITTLLRGDPFVEISADEYERFKHAKKKLLDAIVIEEKFDLLMQNYAEYERDLLNMTLDHMLFSKFARQDFNDNNLLANRRVTNTLMSGRLYV